jgi:hypothetical protein
MAKSLAKECRGSFVLHTACGECARCVRELLELISNLTDTDDCAYDHNDRCHTHQMAERPCPHDTATKILLEWQGELD